MTARVWTVSAVLLATLALSASADAQEQRGMDIRAYCLKVYGDSADIAAIRNKADSWQCTLGKRAFPIDMNALCRLQYDDSYRANLANPADSFSWSCVQKSKPAG